MTQLWRIHLKPDAKKSVDPAEFAINQRILGVGWKLENINNNLTEADWKNYTDYVNRNDEQKGIQWLNNWRSGVVNLLHDGMKINDLCWARDKKAIYYLGCVVGAWEYRAGEIYRAADLVNVRDCDWVRVGGIDSVPGKVFDSFIPSRTLQRINDDSSLVYSKLVYNQLKKEKIYADIESEEMELFSLLDPFDCEDLVGIYLQKCHDYKLIPSTCKRSVEVTEFVLVKPNKVAHVQVKQGEIDLNRDRFRTEPGILDEWFLFNTEDKYSGPANNRVNCLSSKEMKEFAFYNVDIMPSRVQRKIKFLKTKKLN